MKYIYIVIILLLVGCSDDFISIPPYSTAGIDQLFRTEKDYKDATIGMYSILRDRYQTFWQFDLASDDAVHQWPTEDIRKRIDNFTFQTDEGLFLNSWIDYYKIIYISNFILDKLNSFDDDLIEINRNQYEGEAKFLRAFAYFDLVRIFGGVPIVTEIIDDTDALEINRSSILEVYEKVIFPDLNDAISKLPINYPSSEIGRATKGAAMSILGKAYITVKDFVSAESVLKNVVELGIYKLLNDYKDLFDYDKEEHHSEYVFDIEYEEGVSQGSVFTNEFFPEDPAMREHFQVFQGAGNTYTPSSELFEIFEFQDARREITASRGFYDSDSIFVPISPGVGANSFTLKYMTPINLGGDSKVNWKVVRYADILLMLAEALNENGKTEEALVYLNQVRKRAKITDIDLSDQNAIREKIYLERRLELSLEGHRWFDLVRTGRAFDILKDHGMKEYMTLFPIPLDEIRVVDDINIFPQNPGY